LIVRDTKPQIETWVKRERGLGHVTYFSNIGIPLISLEWLMMRTLHFASRLIVRDTKRKKGKIGQKRAWPRSRAVSRSHDLINKLAIEALKHGKIRGYIVFEFQHGYWM